MPKSEIRFLKALKFDTFNSATGEVEGYASKFNNIDQVGDIVEPGAFAKSLSNGAKSIRFLAHHDRQRPIGVLTELKEDAKGLRFKAQFANTRDAQDIRELMKIGAMDSFSIGYIPVKEQPDEVAGRRVTRLKELRLLEISAVTFPANTEATLNAIKSELDDAFAALTLEQQMLAKAVIDAITTKAVIIQNLPPKPEEADTNSDSEEEVVEEVVEPTETNEEDADEGDDEEKQVAALEHKLAVLRLETALRKSTKR